ncbi:Thiol-disulfide oxidoreductase ResA [Seminavis robusta]|uniref:thioredoxin-dependent peroxiredoxin n=1 Tax=Seminavis robusta TaxID=568900 RepID=A0A9N8D8L7_9STRA|nr:Thiol-disulfide oxidoreductase ResA [Seminavis robusta]|eukprot:Sro16_g011620.1 Thiol-disulfide oxidoreductase ResA (222) ;mRNA; r:56063-56728
MSPTATIATASLAAELKAFQDKFMASIPKEVGELLLAKTEELAKSGVVESAIKVGDKAPDFVLPDVEGNPVSLAELRAKGPVVLTFYRGSWCPYCNITVHNLQQYMSKFQAKGATLVAISPELPDYVVKKTQEESLTFPVLSDVGMTVGMKFGLKFVLPLELQKAYAEFGLDVPSHNGDKTFQLPLPATYVIDKDGLVTYAFVNADYTKRAEPEEVLKAIP